MTRKNLFLAVFALFLVSCTVAPNPAINLSLVTQSRDNYGAGCRYSMTWDLHGIGTITELDGEMQFPGGASLKADDEPMLWHIGTHVDGVYRMLVTVTSPEVCNGGVFTLTVRVDDFLLTGEARW